MTEVDSSNFLNLKRQCEVEKAVAAIVLKQFSFAALFYTLVATYCPKTSHKNSL